MIMPARKSNATVITLPTMAITPPKPGTRASKAEAEQAASRVTKATTPKATTPKATTPKATTPKATTPKATTPKATTPKATSPVRKDVKPADVKPDAHTPAETKQIATLESLATRYVGDGMKAADQLAHTMVRLFPLSPWDGRKLRNGHPMTVQHYYATLLGGFDLPTDARRVVVKAMGNDVDVQTVVDMTGSSARSIARDRDALGIANVARQQSHKTPATGTDTDATPAPAATGPVTRMVPVLSMTSVREFILGLDDVDMVTEIMELCQERILAL